MNKDELLRIALSGKVTKTYREALGFDDCEKMVDALNLKLNEGKHIPVWIVYLFYYRWVKESNKRPENYSVFVFTWGKHTRSIPYGHGKVSYRCYKIQGFPSWTFDDEIEARKLIREQKEKIRKQKKRRSNKKIL